MFSKDIPEYPNNLTAAEYHELAVGSAIHPSLIERNFLHIEGESVYEYLFISPAIPRKNAGRVTDGFLRAYQYLTTGGMWISGLDPINNWRPMEWGRLKPTNPRLDWEKGKPVKYESPPKTPNRVTYFDISDYVWDKVAKRYNIKRYHSSLSQRLQDKLHALIFWEWVIRHPEIPIILCEGEKKAACLLSLGFVALALPGIWNGRVGKQDFDERLHPDLIPLAQPGRKFQILFDYETKLKTRWSVFQATVRTGKAIEQEDCICEVALLPGTEKGVDDFVVARGDQANELLTAIANDALSLKDYQQSFLIKHRGLRKYKPDIIVDVQYLTQALKVKEEEIKEAGEQGRGLIQELPLSSPSAPLLLNSSLPDPLVEWCQLLTEQSETKQSEKRYRRKKPHNQEPKYFVFPRTGLIVLISDMGTGKTELMRWWRDAHPDQRFLNNGHRVNLLKNLAERLKTEMYSDLGYTGMAKAIALSITIDSLHKLNTQALTYGCIFIDEACQYLTHLLLSNTCKEHRAAILEVLQYIVYNAPMVVIADAHMDDVTIDFFRAMRPEGEQPVIIKNEWKNGDRTIYWYEGQDSSALVAQISAALMMGQKIMVVSDSKRFIKKLEKMFSVRVEEAAPGNPQSQTPTPLRIWSIHSDNSGSEENVAFIKDITNAVKNIDALFTSPSLGTGVDIPEYHFDLVFGVFHGVSQTATECAQQLWRYRPKVPIHVWVASKPPFGYLDTNPTKIKERLLQTNEITAFLLRIDRETGKRGAEKEWAMDAYCQIKAARHQSLNNLRADLRSLLSEMGNHIVPVGDENDTLAWDALKQAADALDTAHHYAVAKANNISKSEYRARQSKDYLSPEEIVECEKFRIHDAYGMEVTPELVEKDDGGRLIAAIASLEAILGEPSETIVDSNTGKQYPVPPAFVTSKDRAERDKLPFCMDWGNYSAKWLARFNLGLHHILQRLVAGEDITASDPHLYNMTAIAVDCAAHIKAILGFTIPPDCQPIWLLATLLEQLGLKLTYRKQGKRGMQVKIFSLSKAELEFARKVIAHRQQQRNSYAQMQSHSSVDAVSPPVFTPPHNGIGNSHCEGVDTTPLEEDKEQGAGGKGEISSPLLPAPCPSASPTPDLVANCVKMLRSGIAKGVSAIKDILKRWSTDLRWQTVLELEAIALDELRTLEQSVPDFYQWLSEDVLPMEG
ncbi:plasmid replication protein, CyRepA1 family [Anabaena sp. UHCC 0399]|uniref:plasmid replication protein, CyRepA1 family n=1 Tax=Anabaena sp. UHCC 0399 TaxID=3110238 RepID=UPI002B204635|nr:plasmid replication protein, CyRepA1 family [Anabaena sp. UHCC 0399]MEA5567618.1 plasmid replication protein, CyRepA1 family [Anabaena sp. UHCC 0399]